MGSFQERIQQGNEIEANIKEFGGSGNVWISLTSLLSSTMDKRVSYHFSIPLMSKSLSRRKQPNHQDPYSHGAFKM